MSIGKTPTRYGLCCIALLCIAVGCEPDSSDEGVPLPERGPDTCAAFNEAGLRGTTWIESREELVELHESECSRVGSWLRLYYIPGVTDLRLLEHVREVNAIEIGYAEDLESLDGLENIARYTEISIHHNPKLTDTSALSVPEQVEAEGLRLSVTHNESLQSLEGLSAGLDFIPRLRIVGNASLQAIPALDDAYAGSAEPEFTRIKVTRNPMLPTCKVQEVVDRVPEDKRIALVEGNADADVCQ